MRLTVLQLWTTAAVTLVCSQVIACGPCAARYNYDCTPALTLQLLSTMHRRMGHAPGVAFTPVCHQALQNCIGDRVLPMRVCIR